MASAAKIIGLAKLHRKLKRMPEAAKTRIRAALEKSADEIVRMAKGLVPVDSGALRDSIGWTWGRPPQGALTLGKVAASSMATDLTITIYAGTRDKKLGDADAFYARWVEFGTQKMKAQPYFYPAYRANKKGARSRVRRAISKAARETASS